MYQNISIKAINALDTVRLSLLLNNEIKNHVCCIDYECQKRWNGLTDPIQISLIVRLSVI